MNCCCLCLVCDVTIHGFVLCISHPIVLLHLAVCFMVKLRQHFRAAFYAWLIWFSIILFVQFCSLLLFSYKRRYISQFLSGFLVIFAYLRISFFDAFKGAFSFRLVCSYCPVAFCLVLVTSLLIVLWAWCRYTQRFCLFADLRPISIILIYTLGRACFNSCFCWSMNAFAVACFGWSCLFLAKLSLCFFSWVQ
jgi:hypothetical protein